MHLNWICVLQCRFGECQTCCQLARPRVTSTIQLSSLSEVIARTKVALFTWKGDKDFNLASFVQLVRHSFIHQRPMACDCFPQTIPDSAIVCERREPAMATNCACSIRESELASTSLGFSRGGGTGGDVLSQLPHPPWACW